MACSSTCDTQNHATFGECLRSKNLRVGWSRSAAGIDRSTQKRWDSRLQEWREARRQGIKPRTTRLKDIREAVKISDQTGQAFRGY